MSSSRSVALVAAVAFAVAMTAAAKTPRFGFGKAPTPQEVAGWDIDVRPDGKGLPPGRGSVAQGQIVYDDKCASCHGTFGESNDYMALSGGIGTLASDQPIRTTASKLNHATTLWDYINRAMPFQAPKTLGPDEVYALTAYLLHLNDLLPADAWLDRESLPRVKLPNRDGFTINHGLAARDGKPDTRNVACMRDCGGQVKLASEIPDYARDAHGNLAEQVRSLGPVNGRATAGVPVAAGAAPRTRSAGDLAKSAGCMACHGVSNKVVGPGFREVGNRYASDAAGKAGLVARVRDGGAGRWGSVPMPAQTHVADRDLEVLVQWILAGSP